MKTKCEIYSRVVGYIRPIQTWNDSQQTQFHNRKNYNPTQQKSDTKWQ